VWVNLLWSGTVQLYQGFNGWSWFLGSRKVQAFVVVGVGLECCEHDCGGCVVRTGALEWRGDGFWGDVFVVGLVYGFGFRL
jgi:hypothetical protein